MQFSSFCPLNLISNIVNNVWQQRVFTTDKILKLLDDFNIPADGECSDLSDYESDDDNEELASERNLVEEQSTVLDVLDVGDNANDVERHRSRSVKSFDFSIYNWCIGHQENFSRNYGQFRQSHWPNNSSTKSCYSTRFFQATVFN